MDNHIVSYFITLFSTSVEQRPMDFPSTLKGRVSNSMGANLDKEFTAEEINLALNQMHHTKAPSQDGMPPFFYQCYWHVMGPKVIEAFLYTLNQG